MLDSISTNFARENTIYRGVRLWSMFNNPNKNYLCIKVNDTLIIVTDSELLFVTIVFTKVIFFFRCFILWFSCKFSKFGHNI